MARRRRTRGPGATADPPTARGPATAVDLPAGDLPAGDFSSWLRDMRRALRAEDGVDVDCSGCDACCTSSLFVHIRAGEGATLCRIPEGLAVQAPGSAAGDRVLGYDEHGRCPMLHRVTCSIYEHRPATCRIYDCRLFAAAGITAGGDDRRRISERAARWRFGYPTESDRLEHEAVRRAARFINENAASFPGGRVPSDASQLAVLAVKAYEVFMPADGTEPGFDPEAESPPADELARAVVEACRRFDGEGS